MCVMLQLFRLVQLLSKMSLAVCLPKPAAGARKSNVMCVLAAQSQLRGTGWSYRRLLLLNGVTLMHVAPDGM